MSKNLTKKKLTEKDRINYHQIEVNNRYFTLKSLPNKTKFFSKSHVCGDGGDQCDSGPVYWELPGCNTLEEANKLAEELHYIADQDLAYIGGCLDEGYTVKKNPKFKDR